MQKQKGKTATMVSGNRKKCGQTGYSATGGSAQTPMHECVPTHQSWQEGAGAADAQEAGQEEVGVGDVDRKEQVMTNREGGHERESGGRRRGMGEWNEWGHQRGAITTDCCP